MMRAVWCTTLGDCGGNNLPEEDDGVVWFDADNGSAAAVSDNADLAPAAEEDVVDVDDDVLDPYLYPTEVLECECGGGAWPYISLPLSCS